MPYNEDRDSDTQISPRFIHLRLQSCPMQQACEHISAKSLFVASTLPIAESYHMDAPITFPDGLPDNSPLLAAVSCSGLIYMVSLNNPVHERDCLSQAERGRAIAATGENARIRHGLSVFPDFASCSHQQSLFPILGKYIATARLDPSHGKIRHTPAKRNPSHMTWWPFKDLQRSLLFTLAEA